MDNTHLEKNTSYIASQDLLDAVNIAVTLQKPLLVKGEPGTGKTMLAHAVAETMNKPLFIWNIKSTTKAQDGLYTYDVVQRLYDSQFGENVDDISQYIHYGKMGEAFMADEQVILLIDEIDKADLEFPNDLLWEMDQMEFYVKETHQTIRAKQRPIVIITSNAEKELPDAFFRLFIFHYIEFPDPEQMEKIIHAHFDRIDDELVKQAMDTFYRIRDVKNISKRPSTSELIDWLRALIAGGIDPATIRKNLPYSGVILKKDQDIDLVEKEFHPNIRRHVR